MNALKEMYMFFLYKTYVLREFHVINVKHTEVTPCDTSRVSVTEIHNGAESKLINVHQNKLHQEQALIPTGKHWD